MPIITILVTLVIVGFVLYMVNNHIPMAPPIKTLVTVVAVLLICLWLLSLFGFADYTLPVHRVK